MKRRDFLRMMGETSVLAGAYMAGWRDAVASPKAPLFPELESVGDEYSFAVIADPQVNRPDFPHAIYQTTQRKLSLTVDEINAMSPQPAFVLFDGDLVSQVAVRKRGPEQMDNFVSRVKPLNRRIRFFIVTVLVMLTIQLHAATPNVVIIYFDDTGWTDFGCFGGGIDTPNIDQLAKEGIRFTDYYAPHPNCGPSRGSLLTGRFSLRTGMFNNGLLRGEEVTFAEVLKARGYATAAFGKWHIGNVSKEGGKSTKQGGSPNEQGFDYFYGFENVSKKKNPKGLYRNGEPLDVAEGWSAQIIADEANRWMKEQERPFLAYIAFTETHKPYDAPEELNQKYKDRGSDEKFSVYQGMTEYSDAAVGSILKTLEDIGVSENTFVFLSSDNGPLFDESHLGLRGKKSFVWEGGVRLPAIIRWPGKVEPGTVYKDPVAGVDLMPTLCDITGAELPDRHIDGVSIRPVLEGRAFVRKAPILSFFYRTKPAASMRLGDYVLIGHSNDEEREKEHGLQAADLPYIKNTELISFELYNVREDLGQTNDLGSAQPERLTELKKIMINLFEHGLEEGLQAWDSSRIDQMIAFEEDKKKQNEKRTRKSKRK